MKIGKILGLSLMLALTGCASFTKDEVATVDLPSMSSYANKPNVYVSFNFYQGEPQSASAVEVPQARDMLKPQLQKILSDSGLFGRVTLDEFQKQPGDYNLRLKVYNHPPGGGQMVMAFISGFTFTIIPTMATDQYTMSLEALDPQGQAVSSSSNHDGINTWMGIWFVPLMGNTPKAAVSDTFTRQVNALLKQMVERNSLKYSALDSRVPRV
ncbi:MULTISPECIES: hypothetical protein [Pseudomonas]|uniref:hypothetical protein n=1 Tax=Pseudomonas TaxID=286 RepID=UPI0002724FF9|nr:MULTISPECIES: hypothetical protein [Pseudomonas]AZD01618.1 3-isopropylmalate dehydratase large subunit [Pseudomonas chlororaphis subsp. chlororaphis]MBM0284736.1 hypothetical protein [Pseudomonas chlororaphis]MDO1508462.1 hypothetical protein [Pseudomonas chlororaphis]ORM49580.1 hypothetical protein B6D51_00100 [Pseudomonas chlororaphis subsp. chlororaphis]TWR98857.1 hypothetical protein FJD36_02510 [Pseudomonas chlororaphis subsp. chlororaphis]